MILINKEVIAIQLNDWHLSPRAQGVTELFFTDYRTLPKTLKSGASHTVTFTVHNLEHKKTAYKYNLVATSEDGNTTKDLGQGAITLDSEESQMITKNITVPAVGERIAVKVNLEYQGVAFGESTPSEQTQAIHFWVRIENLPKARKQGQP